MFGTADLTAFINLIYGESLFVFKEKNTGVSLYDNLTNCNFDTAFTILTPLLTIWMRGV